MDFAPYYPDPIQCRRGSMRLPRLQLVELNDLDRTPAPIRDSIVEALSRTLRWGQMLDGRVPTLRRFLELAGSEEILDLGAGAGGPADILAEAFSRDGDARPASCSPTCSHASRSGARAPSATPA